MKRYSANQISNGYIYNKDQEDWSKYWEMVVDYVAQTARGQRAMRIRKVRPNEIRRNKALDKLMVASFDDGSLICYYNLYSDENEKEAMKNLRNIFD